MADDERQEVVPQQIDKSRFNAADVRRQVNEIQQLMKEVMQEDVHYGKIPGCGDKPALFKAGAEKLLLMCRLAPEYAEIAGSMETEDFIAYKIRCTLIHIPSSNIMGTGLGACNSKEKKYYYKKVWVNKATQQEKDSAIGEPINNQYTVINNPWDIQNTLYKMGCKRALVAAVLNVTAASDIFTQDIEDMEEGTVTPGAGVNAAAPQQPTRKGTAAPRKPLTGKTSSRKTAAPAENATVKKPDPVANSGELFSVKEALQLPTGRLFNLEGMLELIAKREVQKKNGQKAVVHDYTISDLENEETTIMLTTWGKAEASEGDIVEATDILGTIFKEVTRYTAKSIIRGEEVGSGGDDDEE